MKNCKTPVVIFVYKKATSLNDIFYAVKNYQPSCLYIVIDKPKDNTASKECEKVKTVVSSFNFNAPVNILSPNQHQGIINIFSFGLDAVFQQEEQAIILEDDTIPSPAFFDYCNIMLARYKKDSDIGCINGCNLGIDKSLKDIGLASVSLPFWGWATWASRWNEQPKDWPFWDNFSTNKNYRQSFPSKFTVLPEAFNRNRIKPKSWDLKWSMFLLSQSKKTIIPGVNMITNTGYSNQATFTNIPASDFNNLSAKNFMLDEVSFSEINKELEAAYYQKIDLFVKEFSHRIT